MVDDQDRCEWVNVSSGTSYPGSPRQRAIKQLLLLLLARRSMSEALMLQALPVWRGPSVCHHM